MKLVFEHSPEIISHRGLTPHADNSMGNKIAGFEAAIDAGAKWVEVDVRRTTNGLLFAHHDHFVNLGERKVPVDQLDDRAISDLGINRLDDILNVLPQDVSIDLDIKDRADDVLQPVNLTTAALAAQAADEQFRSGRHVLLTSFNLSALDIARSRTPQAPVGLLVRQDIQVREALTDAAYWSLDVLGLHINAVKHAPDRNELQTHLEICREKSIEILVWGLELDDIALLEPYDVAAYCLTDVRSALEAVRHM